MLVSEFGEVHQMADFSSIFRIDQFSLNLPETSSPGGSQADPQQSSTVLSTGAVNFALSD
jgi:hypothetical protein